jgi:ferritin-like metal-binding protein YciE
MKPIRNLYDLFLEQLRDLYDGNVRQRKFLEYAADIPESTDLQANITAYKQETTRQYNRLDRIFVLLNEDSKTGSCSGIEAMILETHKLINRCHNKAISDAALITSIQHINHYEIAGYGTAIAYAKVLDMHDIAEVLLSSLRECKLADNELSRIAIEEINRDAKQPEAILKVDKE